MLGNDFLCVAPGVLSMLKLACECHMDIWPMYLINLLVLNPSKAFY